MYPSIAPKIAPPILEKNPNIIVAFNIVSIIPVNLSIILSIK